VTIEHIDSQRQAWLLIEWSIGERGTPETGRD
jgi:hypothetical protein